MASKTRGASITVRVPAELVAKLDKQSVNRSAYIYAVLSWALDGNVQVESGPRVVTPMKAKAKR